MIRNFTKIHKVVICAQLRRLINNAGKKSLRGVAVTLSARTSLAAQRAASCSVARGKTEAPEPRRAVMA
jgi:hypothetical protein